MKITVNGAALITDDAGKPLANYQLNATVHSLEGLVTEIIKLADKVDSNPILNEAIKGMMQ